MVLQSKDTNDWNLCTHTKSQLVLTNPGHENQVLGSIDGNLVVLETDQQAAAWLMGMIKLLGFDPPISYDSEMAGLQ
jgi:hypothetical protein